eukprot:scaffold140644_cov133-Phaeocystis_antarctica.AAC.1
MKCSPATRDAVDASIEAWRNVASSGHGEKPTPKIASDCTEVQPCSARRVDASIDTSGTQSHRAGTAKSRCR